MSTVIVDDACWPVVVSRFPATDIDDASLTAYLADLARLAQRAGRYGMLVDTSAMPRALSARHIARIGQWQADHAAALAEKNVGTAVVVRSLLLRGVLLAFYRTRRPPNPHHAARDLSAAAEWIVERLKQEGVVGDDEGRALAQRVASLATRPPPPVDHPDEPLPEVTGIGAIVDTFDEPAFLLTAAGAIAFRNAAAREIFAEPPPWLARAVSLADEPVDPVCRVTPVDLDGHTLYLVVPTADLVVTPEFDPRLTAPLPPQLERVATLLADGLSDKEVAVELDLTLATVRTYVARLYKRLGIHGRSELIRLWAGRRRWL